MVLMQYTYNHSWQEIHDALSQGRLVVATEYSNEAEATVCLIVEAYIDSDVAPVQYIALSVGGTSEYRFPDANGLVYNPCD